VKFVVLDEADRILHEDFEKEIDVILAALPRERQTFLFSATMTNKVQKLQRASLVNPVKVEVSSKYSTVDTLRQEYLFLPFAYKDCYLAYVCSEFAGSSAIIFCCTCSNAQRIAIMLRTLGFGAIPIHGKMSQSKRVASLNKFKAGQRSIRLLRAPSEPSSNSRAPGQSVRPSGQGCTDWRLIRVEGQPQNGSAAPPASPCQCGSPPPQLGASTLTLSVSTLI
jgi:hypothetical protein